MKGRTLLIAGVVLAGVWLYQWGAAGMPPVTQNGLHGIAVLGILLLGVVRLWSEKRDGEKKQQDDVASKDQDHT